MSICSIEDVAENTTAPFWFQLYMMRDREAMARMIESARKVAKCSALVLTLDLQVIGQRHKDLKNKPDRAVPADPVAGQHDRHHATKPRWVPGHDGHEAATPFGNLVGHVKARERHEARWPHGPTSSSTRR